MNKQRREVIAKLVVQMEEIKNQLEDIREGEQEAYDNMPEGLQQSDRGQSSEEAANRIGDAMDDLEASIQSLYEAAN